MTDEEKDIMQSMLDDSFDRFVNIVKDGSETCQRRKSVNLQMDVYIVQQAEKMV